jgi:hypothetical protein
MDAVGPRPSDRASDSEPFPVHRRRRIRASPLDLVGASGLAAGVMDAAGELASDAAARSTISATTRAPLPARTE